MNIKTSTESASPTATPSSSTCNKSDKKIYLFYADWCPHCTNMMSAWESYENNSNLNEYIK